MRLSLGRTDLSSGRNGLKTPGAPPRGQLHTGLVLRLLRAMEPQPSPGGGASIPAEETVPESGRRRFAETTASETTCFGVTRQVLKGKVFFPKSRRV